MPGNPSTDLKIAGISSQAYILGGSPCSGKSTVAERLARQCNLPYYKVDDHEREHAKRVDPERHPVMYRYAQMTWDEIWMRPVPLQVAEEFDYYGERFEMILDDLGGYGLERPVIVEGAACLPGLVEEMGANPERVVFLVPSKAFQLRYYSQRPWISQILGQCADPEQAFENWMERDHRFGQEILRQAEARGYRSVVVDGSLTVDELTTRVEGILGLG